MLILLQIFDFHLPYSLLLPGSFFFFGSVLNTVFFLFNGLITSFFPMSFVSVKGPGRKLSLPTDLKSDLGTVGRKRAVYL